MIKILALIYWLTPIMTVCCGGAYLVVSSIDKKEAAAQQLRAEHIKRDAEDMLRIGAKIRRERWIYKLEKWKMSKNIKAALMAGAKLIDEMRAQ